MAASSRNVSVLTPTPTLTSTQTLISHTPTPTPNPNLYRRAQAVTMRSGCNPACYKPQHYLSQVSSLQLKLRSLKVERNSLAPCSGTGGAGSVTEAAQAIEASDAAGGGGGGDGAVAAAVAAGGGGALDVQWFAAGQARLDIRCTCACACRSHADAMRMELELARVHVHAHAHARRGWRRSWHASARRAQRRRVGLQWRRRRWRWGNGARRCRYVRSGARAYISG